MLMMTDVVGVGDSEEAVLGPTDMLPSNRSAMRAKYCADGSGEFFWSHLYDSMMKATRTADKRPA